MRYKKVVFSHNQYPLFIRESISISDVYRTMASTGVISLKPNVVLNYSESAGYTDYIRTVSPLVLNEQFDHSVCFTLTKLVRHHDGSYNISYRVLKHCNVSIVIARDKITTQAFEVLKSLKSEWGVRIIVDADDDLFAIPPSHPEYSEYMRRIELYRNLLEYADTISTSTPPVLRGINEHSQTNADMFVIPNYIDERIWSLTQPEYHYLGNTIRVLYSGTLTHKQDLQLLQKALTTVKDELMRNSNINLELNVFGGSLEPIAGMNVIEVPDRCKSYPAFAKWIQNIHHESPFLFAVAPLDTANPLNVAKSNLKYLEYSAMGIPAIYTDILPYRNTVSNKKTGLLVDNDPFSWKNAILEMCLNPENAYNMGLAAYKDVRKNYLLQKHFDDWKNILE